MRKLAVTLVAMAFTTVSAAQITAQALPPVWTVEASSEAPTVAIGGSVVPYKEVTLAAQLPGRVKFIAGIEGDRRR